MAKKKVVTVRDLIENTRLEVAFGADYINRPIVTSDISRPSLEMTGYFDYYAPERVQLIGITETSFVKRMTAPERKIIFRKMAQADTPAFVVSTGLDIPLELQEVAAEMQIPILTSRLTSSRILSNMSYYLDAQLAERKSVHGVLIDVHGLGVLLTGDAGIGKTETALELIQQGKARLVADDRVDIYQQDEERLIGEPSMVLQNLMEVRGVGIIDVQQVYGAIAVRTHATVTLNIHLSNATIGEGGFDRLGTQGDTLKVLDVEIPRMVIPVTPGRNTASVVDAAALKFRTQNMGYDALKTLEERMTAQMVENSDDIPPQIHELRK